MRLRRHVHEHINSAFPTHVCQIATVLPNGFAQVSPRGSTMVFDDEHLALGEQRQGIHERESQGRRQGHRLPEEAAAPGVRAPAEGGIARFDGIATVHRSGAAYEEVWRRLVRPEKDRDPDKKGFAVLIRIERAEDLDGAPLKVI